MNLNLLHQNLKNLKHRIYITIINEIQTKKIIPLANPRGVKLACELCGKTAYYQCLGCRITYYCSEKHQKIDYEGIHKKICDYLLPLKEASEFLGSEDQRNKIQKEIRNKKLEIIHLATTEAKKNMFEEKYELAIPAALQALRYSQDVYKKKSIMSIPSYLLLGKATTGLKNFKQAEDYLLLAKYALFKSKKQDYKIRYQLHRNLGILYSYKKQYNEALVELSNDIYYSSLLHGPEHIYVSGGYFQLGNIFYSQKKYNNALSAYTHVINIWNSYFKEKNIELFDEALQAEAQNMFTRILEIREELLPESRKNIDLAEVYMAFGQLYYITKKYAESKYNFEQALKRYQMEYSNSNINIVQIKSFLREIELNI